MGKKSVLEFLTKAGYGLMVFAIALVIMVSSLPVSQLLDIEFERIEVADIEEEGEEKKESEEKEQNEKFHEYTEAGSQGKSTRDIQMYFKDHLISIGSQEIHTPPPERS